ncbi:C4-dicarboxylate transport protein [Candidatus Clavichlamydia salmonicola]|uniref:dicarboxylate/amino acid:cation symporter n=1 Tax=Candidatus Clavichlamydia salmonicola TaxID=469812 RepID=UPI001891BD03|nr:dicarboxylate/amino acid:cation symporter [Candidatus Clavichlamydia salmonicola]MBF5051067.1 C4-dicarboxylate transport protein [Candidatus Clavichlamydia salmonicola]
MKLWKQMLIGLSAGMLAGLILGERATILKPLGTIFLNLLGMVVGLLVFASITVAITSVKDVKKLGRIGSKTILMYLLTTVAAICFGLLLGKIFHPGSGLSLDPGKSFQLDEVVTGFSGIGMMVLELIPANPFVSFVQGNVLQIIVFAFFLGFSIRLAGSKGKPVLHFFEGLSTILLKMTDMVMCTAPYGVFGIMAWVTGTFGVSAFAPLATFLGVYLLACILHIIIIFFFIIRCMTKLKISVFFKGFKEALALAASAVSSSATLPISLKCVRNLGVSADVANLVLPLGATVNMNGTAIFQGLAAIFVSQAYGIQLDFMALLSIVVTATLSAIGTAGIPGAGIVTLSLVLSAVGLPLEGVALLAGIDRFRDIISTTVNIMGDAIVALYVAKSENELDEKQYYSELSITDSI